MCVSVWVAVVSGRVWERRWGRWFSCCRRLGLMPPCRALVGV